MGHAVVVEGRNRGGGGGWGNHVKLENVHVGLGSFFFATL